VADEKFKLAPLHVKVPPMVPVETLITIGKISLHAGDVPNRVLKTFYTQVLGLTFVGGDENGLRFRHHQREVELLREPGEPRRAGLMIRGFGHALLRLQNARIGVEVLHTDGGLTRTAIVRDPAGNWIHLLETRAF
jgi:catechol-2,3-dioxygenase